jgi:hypothetical protein
VTGSVSLHILFTRNYARIPGNFLILLRNSNISDVLRK